MSSRNDHSYGQNGLTFLDRFGVWLSQRAIRRHLPARNDLELLELGCGYRATHLMAVSRSLKRGIGVDFHVSPELRSLEGFEFHEGSIEAVLPKLPAASVDAAMLISVLEHLSDPDFAIKSVYQLLKPTGVLLVNVPTWRGKTFLELAAFRLGWGPKVEMDDHKMYYDKRDLWPILVRAGFKPSEIRLKYHKFGLNLFAVARK